MTGTRRVQKLPDSAIPPAGGWLGRHLNTILTVLLLIAAVALFVRWRMRTADAERQRLFNSLTTAEQGVSRLRSGYFQSSTADHSPPDSAEIGRQAGAMREEVEQHLADVLNAGSSDDSARMRAMLTRGDLYLSLANLPHSPGTPDPAATLGEKPAELLSKASDAYSNVAAANHESMPELIDGAKMGLAAVAVDRQDWAAAEAQLKAVVDDKAAPDFLAQIARGQLETLPSLRVRVYLVPTSTTMPTTAPTSAPAGGGMMGPAAPTNLPAVAEPSTPPITTQSSSARFSVTQPNTHSATFTDTTTRPATTRP